jgi:hypothetical protein
MAVSREDIAACDSDELELTSPDEPSNTCDHSQIPNYVKFIYKNHQSKSRRHSQNRTLEYLK